VSYTDLVDLFYDALSAHETEEAAYTEVEYISDEAQKLGFNLIDVLDAYQEALRG
jgi:hypothetical protein